MLPVKITPSKETRRRNAPNGSDGGDADGHSSSNDGSPQKALLQHNHYPSAQAPLVRAAKPAPEPRSFSERACMQPVTGWFPSWEHRASQERGPGRSCPRMRCALLHRHAQGPMHARP